MQWILNVYFPPIRRLREDIPPKPRCHSTILNGVKTQNITLINLLCTKNCIYDLNIWIWCSRSSITFRRNMRVRLSTAALSYHERTESFSYTAPKSSKIIYSCDIFCWYNWQGEETAWYQFVRPKYPLKLHSYMLITDLYIDQRGEMFSLQSFATEEFSTIKYWHEWW